MAEGKFAPDQMGKFISFIAFELRRADTQNTILFILERDVFRQFR